MNPKDERNQVVGVGTFRLPDGMTPEQARRLVEEADAQTARNERKATS